MAMDLDAAFRNFDRDLAELRLLHLADSALPIGALAHSFGLESLVSQELLGVGDLPEFLRGFLEEAGMVEAVFCREGFRLGTTALHEERLGDAGAATREGPRPGRDRPRPLHLLGHDAFCADRWVEVNDRLSALKPARESRAASASLGKTFLTAVVALGDFAIVREALEGSKRASSLIHHSTAFGLASGVLGFEADRAVLAYLHQSIASLVSACQRLLPLGQSAATKILWNIKPTILETANRSAACTLDDACGFMPLLDWGAMEHPALRTRLFIS
jgi:urease accessory protein